MDHELEQSPGQLAEKLLEQGPGRGFLVHDPAQRSIRASHPLLEHLGHALLAGRLPFRNHEAVFLSVGPQSRALFAVCVHGTRRGQAQGGVRRWAYPRVGDFLADGLRLSRAMTRKNALADLWWGGGKGLIAQPDDESICDANYRRSVYREFGDFVSSLRGCYIAAEDVGTTPTDVAEMFRRTRFVSCIPPELGGSGNPSPATAAGVVQGMEAALAYLDGSSLEGKRIALQGCGNVGGSMIELLLARGVGSIVASDTNEETCQRVVERCNDSRLEVRCTELDDFSILAEECDVLAPNALGGVLNAKTIPGVQARIVCGSANNPLADPEGDAQTLAESGILYVPDFVCNRMGIVTCGNENYGHVTDDPAIDRHLDPNWENSVYQTTQRVLERAQKETITTVAAANALADELAQATHPLWGHRPRRIIDSVVEDWTRP